MCYLNKYKICSLWHFYFILSSIVRISYCIKKGDCIKVIIFSVTSNFNFSNLQQNNWINCTISTTKIDTEAKRLLSFPAPKTNLIFFSQNRSIFSPVVMRGNSVDKYLQSPRKRAFVTTINFEYIWKWSYATDKNSTWNFLIRTKRLEDKKKICGDAGDRTRGLSHAKRTLYRWATSPVHDALIASIFYRFLSTVILCIILSIIKRYFPCWVVHTSCHHNDIM